MATPDLENLMEEEFVRLRECPPPNFIVRRLQNYKREWHFLLLGESSFLSTSGNFHGNILLPPDYPNSPPQAINVYTPMDPPIVDMEDSSVYSYLQTWDPNTCSVYVLLVKLSEWITENARQREAYKPAHARTKATQYLQTLNYNSENPVFKELFPEYADIYKAEIEKRKRLGIEQYCLPFEQKRKRDYSLYSLIIVLILTLFLIIMVLCIMLQTLFCLIGSLF
ncbi:hypothetical protein SUGI_0474170 [Cryptomeria japonica]|nr:hypothetical protein SUGI_0474170 [Cryptomeria japonica]